MGFKFQTCKPLIFFTHRSDRSMQQPGRAFVKQPRESSLAEESWWRRQRTGKGQETMGLVSALPLPLGQAAALLWAIHIIAKLGSTGWWVPRSPFYAGGAS